MKVIVCVSLIGFKEILVEMNINKVELFFCFFKIVQIGFFVRILEFIKNIEIFIVFFFYIMDKIVYEERVNVFNGI